MTVNFLHGYVTSHTFSVDWETARDEPEAWHINCACGWKSPTVCQRWFAADYDFSDFAEPWRTIAQTYGPDQVLGPDQVWGEWDDLRAMFLHHIGYTVVEEWVPLKRKLGALNGEESEEDILSLRDTAQAVLTRVALMRRALPVKPVLQPHLQGAMEEALVRQRQTSQV